MGAVLTVAFAHGSPQPGVFLPVPGGLSGMGVSAPFLPFESDSHRAVAWNPALGADRELPLYGLSGTFAFPTDTGSGVAGALSAGALRPTAFGVPWFTVDGAFPTDALTAWGPSGGVSFAGGISKRAGDRLALGIGMGTAYQPDDDSPWTLLASLGALIDLPGLGPKGSVLALSLLGPTPMAALNTTVMEGDRFGLSLGGLLAAPTMGDLAGGIGASFALGSAITLNVGWTATLKQLDAWRSGGDDRYMLSPLPSVAIRLDGSSFLKFGSYGASATLGAQTFGLGATAVEAGMALSAGERDGSGPSAAIGPVEKTHYSPLTEQVVSVPLSIEDASRIRSWDVLVVGPDGSIAHRDGAGVAAERGNGISSRLLEVRRGVRVPAEISVPLGELADGTYLLRLSAVDEWGNRGQGAEQAFVVDGTPPAASVSIQGHRRFSPNGDGVRDVLTFEQTGSRESLWRGSIRDSAGTAAVAFAWSDGTPQPFVWDGRGSDGAYLQDGTYSYVLESTDEAGNAFSVGVSDILIDAAPTAPALELEGTALSPEISSNQGSVRLRLGITRPRDVEAWNIAVVDDQGRAVRTWSGTSANLDQVPADLRFDGRTERGDPVPDGSYRFRLGLRYVNGDTPSASSDAFTVDSRRPSGRVRADLGTINPDRNQRTVFYHDLSAWASWRGIVEDETGLAVRTFALEGGTEAVVEWNGVGDAGEPVRDGVYTYYAEGIGAAGLRARTEGVRIRVESGGFDVALIAERELFSALSAEGRLRFYPRIARLDRVLSYTFSIRNSETRAEVRRNEGRAPVPAVLAWNGRDDYEAPVPDGRYEGVLTVRFDAGTASSAVSEAAPVRFALDSTPPKISLSARTPVFSPNGDGLLDKAEFHLDAEAGISWRGEIRDERERVVRKYEWKDQVPRTLSWDGTDGAGAPLRDGTYRLWIGGADGAGNSSFAESASVVLDARVPAGAIAADKTAFSPNGDGFADTLTVRLIPSFSDGIASWRVLIRDSAERTVRVLGSGEGSAGTPAAPPPRTLNWDGTLDNGRPAADGTYRPYAELRYRKGDVLTLEGPAFLKDTAPPRIDLRLSPMPFSPDGDGADDSLIIGLGAADESPIDGWMLTILDPGGATFTAFSGREIPRDPFTWDGRDLEGNLVEAAQDYRYILRVRDALGNMAEKTGTITTDVFVLRDGDRLKIRISSIIFPPSSASLEGERNVAILDRLTTVLEKYPSYHIRVEGHAVNLSGTEREERTELEGLSLARARAVMDALARRGVERSRLEARGLGGREPLVPHGDAAARWRNRRVEFILVR